LGIKKRKKKKEKENDKRQTTNSNKREHFILFYFILFYFYFIFIFNILLFGGRKELVDDIFSLEQPTHPHIFTSWVTGKKASSCVICRG